MSKPFLDRDFLLQSDTARTLFHDYAEKLPIVDYHCHISPAEIADDKRYASITEVWLGGDHYKWRLMRAAGYSEDEITGALKNDPCEVFKRFAAALPSAIGNPIYHWSHLELARYFDIYEPLTADNAHEIYQKCNKRLAGPDSTVRGLIARSNVKLICTTDDPVDSLSHHIRLRNDSSFDVQVLPTLRPDRALRPDLPEFPAYLKRLSEVSGVAICDMASLKAALADRIAFFDAQGCRLSDHAMENARWLEAAPEEVEAILRDALAGRPAGPEQAIKFRSALLVFLGGEYARLGWGMQLHFGALRNINTNLYHRLGPDTGFDAINDNSCPEGIAPLLDTMEQRGGLPRTVLYSLNPNDGEALATVAGGFMTNAGYPGRIQLGAAWWFNDTKSGMERQLLEVANSTLLGNFIGMLTDSRSFLSYTRHEYFRRIFCNFLGGLVENGEYPRDMAALGKIVHDVCYNNAVSFFGFNLPLIQ